MTDSLPIAETFVSIQGEGSLAGTPSWFVRLSGCNLRCSWCDTPYASWRPEGAPRSVESLIGEARDAGVRHAVVTGGEPLLFEGAADLIRRLGAPRDAGGAGMHTTVETAGARYLPIRADLLSVSPKLSNSTPAPGSAAALAVGEHWVERHERDRINTDALQRLLDDHPAPRRQIKFVVTSDADAAEIEALLAGLRDVAPADVMLMPEGVEAGVLRAREPWVERLCARHGWRRSERLHIHLFGAVRGT